MTAFLIDTETTGFVDPQPIEIAIAEFLLPARWDTPRIQRFRPSKPIELGALATHHIMDEDLVGCPPPSSFALPEGTEYLIGYNIDYDWGTIGKPVVKRIDVCAMCRTLWPEADSHSQGAMLYLVERKVARETLRGAHSAATDLYVCGVLLQHAISKTGEFATIEALWQFSERARIPIVMAFGKHKGKRIVEVPSDYRRWLLNQPDVDPYLAQALRTAQR